MDPVRWTPPGADAPEAWVVWFRERGLAAELRDGVILLCPLDPASADEWSYLRDLVRAISRGTS